MVIGITHGVQVFASLNTWKLEDIWALQDPTFKTLCCLFMLHGPGEFPSLLWVPFANLPKTRWNDWCSCPMGYKHVYLLQTPGSCHIKKMDEDSTDQKILLKGHLFHGWEFQGLERGGTTWSSFSLYMAFRLSWVQIPPLPFNHQSSCCNCCLFHWGLSFSLYKMGEITVPSL